MQNLKGKYTLYDKEHVFRKKRSCETQLLELVEDLHHSMQKGQQIDIVVLDFAKAFDKISHARLLYKLEWYGIREQTLNWITDFMRNREQRVMVDGGASTPRNVTSGVPQGSVLEPILFQIYINDLSNKVQSTVRFFADDTIMHRPVTTPQDACALQNDQLAEWEQDWLMECHPKNVRS